MTSYSLADLQKTLSPHVHLGKTRLETLCLLVLGIIRGVSRSWWKFEGGVISG